MPKFIFPTGEDERLLLAMTEKGDDSVGVPDQVTRVFLHGPSGTVRIVQHVEPNYWDNPPQEIRLYGDQSRLMAEALQNASKTGQK